MLSLQGREQGSRAAEGPGASKAPQEAPAASQAPSSPQPRYSHRPLPGGGRIFVTLSDGSPVGVLRYETEKREDALRLLLRAFANIAEERIDRAEPST